MTPFLPKCAVLVAACAASSTFAAPGTGAETL
jgi:hypothetical protein